MSLKESSIQCWVLTDMSDDNPEEPYEINASLGGMRLSVSGPEADVVEELYDDKMEQLLNISEESYVAILDSNGYE